MGVYFLSLRHFVMYKVGQSAFQYVDLCAPKVLKSLECLYKQCGCETALPIVVFHAVHCCKASCEFQMVPDHTLFGIYPKPVFKEEERSLKYRKISNAMI